MKTRLPVAAVVCAAAAQATLADHIKIDPAATYLMTNQDDGSKDAPAIALSSLGAQPGDWLRLERTGSFHSVQGGPEVGRSVMGVFSLGGSLFPSDFRHRVPGALPPSKGGRPVTSLTTFYDNLDTDIDEDFSIDDGATPCTTVRVPKFATYLFLSANDSLFNDNTDPEGDFGVDVTIVAGPCYADFTGDCALDLFDFLAFQNAFVADDPAADCTGDGALDLFDFLCFVNAFNTGC